MRTPHKSFISKRRIVQSALLSFVIWILCGIWSICLAANVAVLIQPDFSGNPLAYDELTNTTPAGQRISVTRLDFLVSDIALLNSAGNWHNLTNCYAYVSGRKGRLRFELSAIPSARYDRIRFHIGLSSAVNHKNAAEYPPGHALNPEVNGLHWGWSGGYVFLALEGRWQANQDFNSPQTMASGYSYHIATDAQLMTIELPVQLELLSDSELRIAFNIDRIFTQPNQILLSEQTNSTHSRTNDSLVTKLRENVEHAFSITSVNPTVATIQPETTRLFIDMAPAATPYRFKMSAFFPSPALPKDNPLTDEGVALGRRLFFDPLLSINNSQSCASCHKPELAFSEPNRVSTGAEGSNGTRNAMPLLNLAWKSSFFWDGRAPSLREQVLQPIQNPIEMHETLSNVVVKLRGNRQQNPNSTYQDTASSSVAYSILFARAFSTSDISADRVARALEQFLLTQTSFDSKFDSVLKGEAQFTAEEQRGFELFHTEYDPRREQFGADCFHCHGGPLFQSQTFANNGLDSESKDVGRYLVTNKEADKARFAVPSLRNVELTGPYMHDGRFATLEEVVEHYNSGIKRNAALDPNLAKHPQEGLALSPADKKALVAFLKTITDRRFLASSAPLNPSPAFASQPRKPFSSFQ